MGPKRSISKKPLVNEPTGKDDGEAACLNPPPAGNRRQRPAAPRVTKAATAGKRGPMSEWIATSGKAMRAIVPTDSSSEEGSEVREAVVPSHTTYNEKPSNDASSKKTLKLKLPKQTTNPEPAPVVVVDDSPHRPSPPCVKAFNFFLLPTRAAAQGTSPTSMSPTTASGAGAPAPPPRRAPVLLELGGSRATKPALPSTAARLNQHTLDMRGLGTPLETMAVISGDTFHIQQRLGEESSDDDSSGSPSSWRWWGGGAPAQKRVDTSESPPASSPLLLHDDDVVFNVSSTTTDLGEQLLVSAWRGVDPDRSIEVIPGGVNASRRYAKSYLEDMARLKRDHDAAPHPSQGNLLWHEKYPFPAFPETSLALALARFTDWVKTWNDGGKGAEEPNARTEDDDDDDDASRLLLPSKRLSSGQTREPLDLLNLPDRSTKEPRVEGAYVVDADGNRLMSRRQWEAASRRQRVVNDELSKQKGFFQTSSSNAATTPSTTLDNWFADVRPNLKSKAGAASNIAVLSGDCGLSKTWLAFEVARRSDSYVVDIHTGLHRSAANVEKLFREATQARRLRGATKVSSAATLDRVHEQLEAMGRARNEQERRAKAKRRKGLSKAAVSNFFAGTKGKGGTSKAAAVNADTVNGGAPPSNGPSDGTSAAECPPLVLVDSGDVSFPDEQGFAAAVRRIALHSKCPVLVTANRSFAQPELDSSFGAGVPQFRISHPPQYALVFYVLAVLCVERPDLFPPDGPERFDRFCSCATLMSKYLYRRSRDRPVDPRSVLLDVQWGSTGAADFESTFPIEPAGQVQDGAPSCSGRTPASFRRAFRPPHDPSSSTLNVDCLAARTALCEAASRSQVVVVFRLLEHESRAYENSISELEETARDAPSSDAEATEDSRGATDAALVPASQALGRCSMIRLEQSWNSGGAVDHVVYDTGVSSGEVTAALGGGDLRTLLATSVAVAFGWRERFDEGSWTLGLGDVAEREELKERTQARLRSKVERGRWAKTHAAASAETLVDMVPFQHTP